ncbi:hypothetical protein D3P04_04220 [Paracoccus onubensis]|uniref:Uncharacterized protein n=1 Tax=Paracoccus onubensis TaxID=1675788 RepID=A0A418T4M3_9RHOB|nr:hypothetical protein D3P04_04220 [Paracoccus onubensis]
MQECRFTEHLQECPSKPHKYSPDNPANASFGKPHTGDHEDASTFTSESFRSGSDAWLLRRPQYYPHQVAMIVGSLHLRSNGLNTIRS